MAKVTEISSEPSQSSTSLPALAENEVELVIDRFWRDTRPRVCVRSETKNVNGFNFRLLVWPQGSKQSQSHLSAFVEVVPPAAASNETRNGSDGAVSTVYPPDWACPCVFYRISVMNFKQKYPYSKADTWTFSYVCPDRGWHTLLDTRYINRRDGYLSNDGALVIRAIAFPRFAHPISVLPLLNSISHTQAPTSPLPSSSTSHRRLGLANILATDHLNSLIQSLFHLPGFRRYIYSLVRKGRQVTLQGSSCCPSDRDSIASGIESCVETVQEVMDRISSASPDISRLIQSEFYNECKLNELCTCGTPSMSSLDPLVIRYGRCRALIKCIEETLMSVSASLNRRTVHVLGNKRIQVDAYCQIIRDCGRILSTVANSLFTVPVDDSSLQTGRNLVEELQIIFAKLEYDFDPSSKSSLIDTRGLIGQLGLCNGGLSSRVSPDGLFVVFFDSLKKCIGAEMDGDDGKFDDFISGTFAADHSAFTHIRVNPNSGTKSITSLDKYIAAWMGKNVEDEAVALEESPVLLASVPKILNIQFLNKVKDRLDAPERVSLAQFVQGGSDLELEDKSVCGSSKQWKNWTEFLQHKCEANITDDDSLKPPISSAYRLHSIMLCSGEAATGHYSVLVRSNRLCGWTHYDDAWNEDFVDAYDLSFGSQGGSNQSNGTTTSSSSAPPSSPDWVFSPEWSCSSLCYVREDAVGELYNRGADVRLIRPDIFSVAAREIESELLGSGIACNRFCPEDAANASTPSSGIDSTCQVEILLITEKDVLAACPGGFSTPFSFSVPNVSRKLIVRKDIPVERLMKAVHEHFKIPIQLQRLHALRYYPETQQERFELMIPSRSIASHLPPSSFDLAPTSSSKSSSRQKSGQNLCSNLYVLVSAVRAGGTCRSVFVKIYDEKSLGIISVGFFNFDQNLCLKEYFEQVSLKANIGVPETPFIVFEEVSARCVELKRTTVSIKDEKIVDGDILIFVPLTDSAKRALIGTSLGCSGGVRPKRRLLTADGVTTVVPKSMGSRRLGGAQCECEDCFETCRKDDLLEDETLDERCKRFLERTRNDPSLIDEAYEEMILNELMMAEEEDLSSDEDVSSSDEDSSRLRFEAIRRLMKKEPSSTRVADLMSDIMKELVVDEGGESVVKSSSRRLDIPTELREEISRISAPMCFYCQLPIASATVLAEKGIQNIGCRVSCTSRCVGQPMLYHDRCVRDLIRELETNPLGPDACIITENCSGRVILDAASIKRLESASLAKNLKNTNCSTSALRSKLGSVLTPPAVPEMLKSGQVRPVVEWKWGSPVPTIPSAIKLPKKGKSQKISLPIESLWWNACVESFGLENLQSAIMDKHWDAGELEKARALFNQWCKQLLEKHHPWRRVQKVKGEKVTVPQTSSQLNTPVQSEESEDSSDDEEVVVEQAPVPAPVVAVSDIDDEDFVLVSNAKGPRRGRSLKQISSPKNQSMDSTDISNAVTPSVVSIPEGLCGPIAIPVTSTVIPTTPSILDEIDYLLVDEESQSEITTSVADTPVTIDSVLESRMNLLPAFVRQYCLPIELVFVYYSEQFFVSRLIDVGYAKTLALIPPSIEKDEEAFLNLITMAAFNNNCAVSRVYVSPVEDANSTRISVQWFIEFSGVMDCHKFASWVGSSHPEWVPEVGALLPASMLGFAV